LAETGTEMSRFASPQPSSLELWPVPRNNESGGKRHNTPPPESPSLTSECPDRGGAWRRALQPGSLEVLRRSLSPPRRPPGHTQSRELQLTTPFSGPSTISSATGAISTLSGPHTGTSTTARGLLGEALVASRSWATESQSRRLGSDKFPWEAA
jgi:hypothetical protein